MPSLLATLGLDATSFQAGMRNSSRAAKDIGHEIKSSLGDVAAASLAGFSAGRLLEDSVEMATHIKQLSNEFRVSVETIQTWQRGAERAGMTADDVGNAMNRLKKARAAAVEKQDAGAFAEFGISLAALNTEAISTEEIMDRIRASTAGRPITDSEDVAGMELMGRSGARILSALQQIHELGQIKVIDQESIEQIHEAELRLKDFKRDVEVGVATTLGKLPGIFDRMALGWEGVKAFMSGTSWNDARRIGIAGDIEAPTVDLKGRPLNGPKHKPIIDPGEKPEPPQPAHAKADKKLDLEQKKESEEIAKRMQRLDEIKETSARKSMTVEEKRASILKEIEEHEKKAMEYELGGETGTSRASDEIKALDERIKAEQLRGEIAADKEEKKRNRFEAPQINELQRIGAYVNPQEATMLTELQKHGQHLAQIKDHLANLDRTQSRTKF